VALAAACSARDGKDTPRRAARLEPDAAAAAPRLAGPERSISRVDLEAYLADRDALGRTVRAVPVALTGYRLDAIRPDSLLDRVGFVDGDVVRSVNGQDLATPELALNAWMMQRWASTFGIDVQRGGVDLRIQIRVTGN
jgi:general secretion pathway protein C